nr:MAG TPA: minor capsid protein [Caudoviricetes sp.]
MHELDSHHFMPAYLCVHRPQSRTAIRHSFCSTLFDSLMDSQIEFGRSCRSGRAADTSWYRQMADTLAHDMEACDEQAAAIINGESPAVYAANMNYGTFDVESVAKLDTSYTLVDADTVSYMVRQQPDLLPQVSVNPGRAETWARRKITSAMTQSILQGESVLDAARRIRSVVEMDRRASLRAARTALTGAENAGRMGSYRRASGMGIELQKQWMASLDSHTRDSHRELDGEKADIDGRFSNSLRYPGDPTGPASEVWNCRCTMVAALPGHDVLRDRNTSKLETSYEEWKAGRDPKKPKPSGRTLKEFMDTPAAERAAKKAGVSKAQLRKRIVAKLGAGGKTGRDFPSMTRAEQQEVLKEAVELTRKQDKPRRNVRVVNDALYNSQKNYVERHGGVVKRDAEAEEHLDKLGAGASSLDDAVLLRPDASTSEVLEEVFHFKQNLQGDYSDAPVDEMVARREIDAQKFLLSVAERYNIPISETELTKRNLARYESDLREILEQRRSGHESE